MSDLPRPTPAADAAPDDLAPLLAAAGRGEARAWRVLVDRYSRRVFALAKSRCRNEDVAEEIAQSVFATVASKVGSGQYTESGHFEAWLFRVAMNRVRDVVRQAKRRPAAREGEGLEDRAAAAAAEPVFDGGMVEKLREAMTGLPEADREVLELRHHGGLSFKQMAEVLDEPVGTLLARHHRALRKLRGMLQGVEDVSEVHHER